MASPKSKIVLVCRACADTFSVSPSRSNALYCSLACSKTMHKGAGNGNWKGGLIERNCLACGSAFSVKPKTIKAGGGKYCSVACANSQRGKTNSERAKRSQILKTCAVCGKSKGVRPSHVDKAGTYCSRECMKIGYSKRMLGTHNPNYKGAGYENRSKTSLPRRILRLAAKRIRNHSDKDWQQLKRSYENTCPCCRNKNVQLTKDHIVPITKGGDNGISNIQPLCQRCNVKKFTKTIVYHYQLVIPFA